jgi:two-component sensor histidine kinase
VSSSPESDDMAALVAAHDWKATPLGPREEWSERLEAAVDICLSSPIPMAIWWGADLAMLYNDHSVPLLGRRHPDALGRPAAEVWTETWSTSAPLIEQVLRTGKAISRENLLFRIDRGSGREEAFFSVSYSPLHEADGSIAGLLISSVDTTEKILADRKLKAQVERQRRLFEQAPGFIAIVHGADHVFEFVNEAFVRLVGNRDFIGNTAASVLPDLRDQPFFKMLDEVYASGQRKLVRKNPILLQREGAAERHRRFIDFIYEPVVDDDGHVTGIFVEGFNVTDQVEAEQALLQSEHARAIALESGGMGAWRWNLREDTMQADAAFMEMFDMAQSDAAIPMATFIAKLTRDSAARFQASIAKGISQNLRFDGEVEVIPSDGGSRWIKWQGSATSRDPETVTGVSFDITQQKLAARRQDLLLAELQHRVRNILAMIRSVVVRTAATSDSVEEYARHLEGRISAMARTQALLTRSPGAGIDLQNLILDELQAQIAQEDQVNCYGPDVLLSPKGAEVLTLAVHELATNSVKYGALSAPEGRVEVRWDVNERRDPPWLILQWIESGIAVEREGLRQGFGTELVTRRVPYELGGKGMMNFGRFGLTATIEYPLRSGDSILQTNAANLAGKEHGHAHSA